MAAMTDAQLRVIRDEVGSAPSDDDLQDLWDELGGTSTTAVALAVLRPRMADALAAAAQGGATLPGVIGVVAPAQPALLAAQISRLEGQLAAETGTADESGLSATSVIAGRRDRVR